MRKLLLLIACAFSLLSVSTASAAFVSQGSVTLGATGYQNTLNFAVDFDGSEYTYYYQLMDPVAGQTSKFSVNVSSNQYSSGPSILANQEIDLLSSSLVGSPTNSNPFSATSTPSSISLLGTMAMQLAQHPS